MYPRSRHCAYVIVSPVRDEEEHIAHTLRSVLGQTRPPRRWIIVDDGSRDATPEIVGAHLGAYPWLQLVSMPAGSIAGPGTRIIRAFNHGYALLPPGEHAFVVKLDCDLSFGADYFEQLLARFEADPRLGIASGAYAEADREGNWREIRMPAYHAAGAAKMVRRKCFEDIGGFVASPGWDTVDEIRAIARGWQTRHFTELPLRHHKPEGTRAGALRTSIMHGEVCYLTGGGSWFLGLKLLRRLATKPFLLAAAALLWGYIRSALRGRPLLVTAGEARLYRRVVAARLPSLRRARPIGG